MKPSKKQINKSRKSANEVSNPKIKDFFKTTPKSLVVPVVSIPKADNVKDFYVALAKEKLRILRAVDGVAGEKLDESAISGTGEEDNIESASVGAFATVVDGENDDIENNPANPGAENVECPSCAQKTAEYKVLDEKYQEMKKRFVKLNIHHSELDLKYADLLKASTGKVKIVDNAVPETGDVFTANELKYLESLPLDKQKDSTFIHQCLQFTYKEKLDVLVNKTLMGTKDWIEISETKGRIEHPAKDPLTPAKVNRIRELFIARIAKCNIDAVAYGERIGNVNKHFASGIKNISKKQQNANVSN